MSGLTLPAAVTRGKHRKATPIALSVGVCYW